MRLRHSAFLLFLLASGCNKDSTTSTSPTGVQTFNEDMFTGSIPQQGSAFYTISVLQTGQVSVLLASLTTPGTAMPIPVPLNLSIGTLSADGTSCIPTTTVSATPALQAQMNQQLDTGAFCVMVADAGSVPIGGINFVVRIDQNVDAQLFGTPGTETFSSNVYPGGFNTRTFSETQAGTINVNLASVTPSRSVGVAVGVSIASGGDCAPTVTFVGSTGQVSIPADRGTFCVRTFDPGSLSERVLVNLQIAHQ